MPFLVEITELELLTIPELLLVAALVAIAAAYLRLPYTVALVITGLFIGFGDVFDLRLDRDLILLLFLPPLLFEGAINMDLEELRERWLQVATLALVGTVVATGGITASLVIFTDLPIEFAVLLAVMLAPTDPVSVLAIFKENGVAHGLRTLVEGESIFNDALGIVLFVIAVDVAFPGQAHEAVTWQSGIYEFGSEVVIGAGVGVAAGYLAHQLMRPLSDHLIEITLSAVLIFGSFLVADQFGGSGVIAVVAAGLFIGNYGQHLSMTPSARVALLHFWEVIGFLINSALFLLIGLQFDIDSLSEGPTLTAIGASIAGLLLGRIIVAYGLLAPFRNGESRVPLKWQHVVYWGGLRGSIPIALVLGLTLEQRQVGDIDLGATVFAVVLFSLVVQGLTFKPLLNFLGVTERDEHHEEFESRTAEVLASRAELEEIRRLWNQGELAEPLFENLQTTALTSLAEAQARLSDLAANSLTARARQLGTARRRIRAARQSALGDAVRRGVIADDAARQVSERYEVAEEEAELAESGTQEPGEPK